MNKILSIFMVAVLGMAVFSSTSFASGFRLAEQDSAATGMSSAFVGQADSPAAVWYNPAGITQLDGTRISGGVIGVYPVLTHETIYGTTDVSERDVHLPVHLYATHRLNDSIVFGVGVNNPFGLVTDWNPQTSVTKNVATFSKIVSTEINPNIAYKISDNLSIAFGIAYVHLRATLENILPVAGSPDFRLSGDGDGWGANAAMKYKATDQVSFGLSYRSRVKVKLDGTAEIAPGLGILSNPGSTEVTLPDLIQAGVSYKASDKLTVNADIDYTLWSTYDRLVIQSNTILLLTGGTSNTATEEKQWHDVWCIRLGGQYQLSDQWKLRAGYVYDKNPVNDTYFDTITPDSDRQGVSIGTGYTIGNTTVDLAYMYLRFNKRTLSDSLVDGSSQILNGTYKSQAQLAGITIGYKF